MGVYIFDGEPCPSCDGTGGNCVDGLCYECYGNGYINDSDACVVCGMPSSQGCDCEEPAEDTAVGVAGGGHGDE